MNDTRLVYEKIYTLHNEYATASYFNEILPIEVTDDINILAENEILRMKKYNFFASRLHKN